jgi:hypothetical protein
MILPLLELMSHKKEKMSENKSLDQSEAVKFHFP